MIPDLLLGPTSIIHAQVPVQPIEQQDSYFRFWHYQVAVFGSFAAEGCH